MQVIDRFGGFVAQFTGDGIMAYFGYPSTRENDVERALLAALELIAKLPQLDTRIQGQSLPPLAVRVGVHSGLVLVAPEVGLGGPVEVSATGEAVNVASRLQTAAPVGGILASQESVDLVAGRFEVKPLGKREIRGLSRGLAVCEVLRALPAANATAAASFNPLLVGRDPALGEILGAWLETLQGRRQTVVVSGEPGIGKSRLATEFLARADVADATILKTGCDEIFANTAFYAVSSFLWTRAGLALDDTAEQQLQKCARLLAELGLAEAGNIGLLASLLGIAETVPDPAVPTPQLYKRKQFDLVLELIGPVTAQRPMILWIDDVQWLDASSAELLRELATRFEHSKLLILLTSRLFPPGPQLPDVDLTVELTALDRNDCLRVAAAVPGAERLPPELLEQAIDAAEGLPLFLEQLVVALVEEQGTSQQPTRKAGGVPLRLAKMMSERLDRRPGGRRMMQVAACIGRSFTPDLLAALIGRPPPEVAWQLQELVHAELLVQRRLGTDIVFEFRHSLIQRIAYESIVHEERQETHDRLATAFGQDYAHLPNSAELLAHHLAQAGRIAEAVSAWLRLGAAAARNSFHVEAIETLRRALALLDGIEPTTARHQLELKLQLSLMGSLIAARGATADEVSVCCQRGLELCGGDASAMMLAFAFGQFTFTNCRGDIAAAETMAKLFLNTAETGTIASGRVIGHRMLGTVKLGQGKAREAVAHFDRSLELYVPERDSETTQMFGQSTEVHTKSSLSLAYFCLGDLDRSITYGVDALQSADQTRHPHSTAIPLTYVSHVFGLCTATSALERQGQALVALAEQHEMWAFRAHGHCLVGWAHCQRGDVAAGEQMLAAAIAELESIQFNLAISGYLAIRADALRRLGRIVEARTISARSIAGLARSSFAWFEPEARRIAASIECTVSPATAQAGWRDAAACARRLGSPYFERRCLADLIENAGDAHGDAAERMAQLPRYDGLPERILTSLEG